MSAWGSAQRSPDSGYRCGSIISVSAILSTARKGTIFVWIVSP